MGVVRPPQGQTFKLFLMGYLGVVRSPPMAKTHQILFYFIYLFFPAMGGGEPPLLFFILFFF
jgi:hypothetical protein